ncbi:hypothetical protein HPB49_009313 [Dermacentor silvarum]|uniref:Uncharacterized protein n=1 Tax=Dermacentor silvarum TaxID=543639 RepID=A0ACB8DY07_DERSI|nr:hypothetical protein HPB49_009313 [Dermacentor silvarum]
MEGQLRSKRDEFWDTAPAFEGRKEIWDALKAAAYAAETNDFTLAQAIIDGANISLPNGTPPFATPTLSISVVHVLQEKYVSAMVQSLGTLLDCYDELGNRYQLPVYCLSAPGNLVEDASDAESPSPESEPCAGHEILLKLRLSTTGKDTKMAVRTGETILAAKRRLEDLEGIPASHQRWFFGGKLLSDRTRVDEAKLQMGFVVQVAVATPS